MFAFSNDPFKPLTEIERVFANAQYLRTSGRVVIDGQVYVTFQTAIRLLTVGEDLGQRLWQTEGWRTEKWPIPGDRPINVYALQDVRRTAKKMRVVGATISQSN